MRKPNGDSLIDDVNLELNTGDALVIKGPSGGGKTTLLRSLAQLWPYTDGHWSRPDGEHETMFISQLPYIPLGNLRDVVSYPAESGTFSDEALREILEKVSLAHLVDRLEDESDWIKVLSPASNSVLPSHASCSSSPRWSSWTNRPRHSTKVWSSRSIA